jgi:predicted HTH domain antitoxin
MAVAIHRLGSGDISVGKAAELAGEPRATFELLRLKLAVPSVEYDIDDYEQDLEGLEEA